MSAPRPPQRVLAVDPTSRGFGFVLLEGPASLVDWGIKEVRRNKKAVTLSKVRGLIERYRPNALVVEDCDHDGSKRRTRVRALVEKLVDLAHEMNIRAQKVPLATVRAAFSAAGTATKHDIAVQLAQRFPALAPRLPPRRTASMNEPYQAAVFDAVALAAASFQRLRRRTRVTSAR